MCRCGGDVAAAVGLSAACVGEPEGDLRCSGGVVASLIILQQEQLHIVAHRGLQLHRCETLEDRCRLPVPLIRGEDQSLAVESLVEIRPGGEAGQVVVQCPDRLGGLALRDDLIGCEVGHLVHFAVGDRSGATDGAHQTIVLIHAIELDAECLKVLQCRLRRIGLGVTPDHRHIGIRCLGEALLAHIGESLLYCGRGSKLVPGIIRHHAVKRLSGERLPIEHAVGLSQLVEALCEE